MLQRHYLCAKLFMVNEPQRHMKTLISHTALPLQCRQQF